MATEFNFVREIRDPLYGYIYITSIENDIIDSDVFQRLGRIYQNTSTHFVYPNATHTRKAHSLGVMHLAHKATSRLLYRHSQKVREEKQLFLEPTVVDQKELGIVDSFDEYKGEWWNGKSPIEILQSVRLAALIHDIGHGPFSHVFEEVCKDLKEQKKMERYVSHEQMSVRILREKLDPQIKNLNTEDIAYLLEKPSSDFFLRGLIDGPYDVDKLDYLNRDSYHAGTREYGNIDYERIIDGFRVKDNTLLISKSAIGALMSSFNSASYMYMNVYYHKTCRIFDFMIYDALLQIPEFINEITQNLDEFLELDDFNFLTELKRKMKAGDNYEQSYQNLKDVVNRKKRYALIYGKPLTLRVASKKDNELRELKDQIEKEYGHLKVRVDFSGKVRPIRIDPFQIPRWLIGKNILDADDKDNPRKSLEEISRAYLDALNRYQVLFFIFIDRAYLDKETDIQKIRSLAETQLVEIEKIELL